MLRLAVAMETAAHGRELEAPAGPLVGELGNEIERILGFIVAFRDVRGGSAMNSAAEAKALVVDDDPVARSVIVLSLKTEQFACDQAADGNQALEMISATHYDLIVTDLRMPHKHGHALSIELLSRQPVPLLVVHSAVTDPRLCADLIRRGVDDVIAKPTDYRLFAAKMKALVDRRRSGVETGSKDFKAPEAGEAAEEATASRGKASKGGTLAASPATKTATRTASPAGTKNAGGSLGKMKFLIVKSEVLARIDRGIEVKTMSPLLTKLLGMLGAAGCSMKEVAQTIRQDQALCLKILKLANSCVYSQGTHVDSVEKAVMRIGTGQIRQAIMNIGIIELFSSSSSSAGIDLRQFWEHSLATGLIAAELSRCVAGSGNAPETELAFTSGLLHDIGRAVLAEQLGEVYQKVMEESQNLDLPLELAEKQLLQVDHSEIAHRVLTSWRFSKQLLQPIQRHHQPVAAIRQLAPAALKEVAVLALADRLAHAMLLGRSGNEVLAPTAELAGMLKLPADIFGRLIREIPERLEELRIAMLHSAANQAKWPSAGDEYRGRVKRGALPVVVSADQDHDEIALLVSQLIPGADDEQGWPNMAVIHITDPKGTAELASRLAEAEARAGSGALPLLIASPDGRQTLDASVAGTRRCVQVASNTGVGRFIESLNGMAPGVAAAAPEVMAGVS